MSKHVCDINFNSCGASGCQKCIVITKLILFTGLFQTVVTGSLPWNEDGIELDYNKNFHTSLLVPLRDFIQDGIHFTVIKTKHTYVLEDPNALQNMEIKPPASAKSKRKYILSRIQLFLMTARKVLQRLLCRHIDWTKAIVHKCRNYC